MTMHSANGTTACIAVIACVMTTVVLAQPQQRTPGFRPDGILGTFDQRVPISSDNWPWSAIGRVNVVQGPSHRSYCTGTLISPQHVLTAAHCLFDTRLDTWVKPHQVHFVVGQSRDGQFKGHSVAAAITTDPAFKFAVQDRPRYDQIRADQVPRDWAIIMLANQLDPQPVPWLTIHNADLPGIAETGEVARAGYSRDRPFLLTVHRRCSAKTDKPQPGTLMHQCDSMPGDSGSPILLLKSGGEGTAESASIIGIHTGAVQSFEPGVGYTARAALGVSAGAFGQAARSAIGTKP